MFPCYPLFLGTCFQLCTQGFIQQACEALDSGYHPKITFIVAQKRQHTRFFPVPNSHCMRNGNVLPGKILSWNQQPLWTSCISYYAKLQNHNTYIICAGTIIDKDVCHPSNYDFFLCSHAGLYVHLFNTSSTFMTQKIVWILLASLISWPLSIWVAEKIVWSSSYILIS